MRGLVRGLIGGAVVAGLALGAVALIPAGRVADLAAAEFQRLTGRELTIGGGVRAAVWPVLGVTMGDVALANAAWSTEGPMLTAERLSMGLSLSALVRGEVRVTGIEARGLRLTLERSAEGQGNWDFAAGQAGAGSAAAGTPFALDRAFFDGTSVLWIDHASGQRAEALDLTLDLSAPDPGGPVAVTARARIADQPVGLTATADGFAAALAGRVVPLRAEVAAGGSTLGFAGRAGWSPAAAEGQVTADLADLRALAALSGTAPDLPEGLGARVRQLVGQVTLAPAGSVHLREALLTLDGNAARVAADLTLDGPRPRLAAQIDAGILRLAGPSAAAPSPRDAGWPRGAIDVAGLALADAAIALRAEGVAAGPLTLGRTRAMVTVDRARAVVALREVQAWGGTLAGEFVVNGRGGLSVRGDLTASGIAIRSLLAEIAGQDRLSGTGDLRLKVLGVGNSIEAIMASLSGEGALSLARGELRGLDLLGMLRNLDPGFVGEGRRTIFDSLAASFTIRDGVLSNEDLTLEAPYLAAAGAGTLDLGAQRIDYRVTPTALTGEDGAGGVRVPVQITGPWSAPRFGLDLGALAEQELADERARLEAAARAAADRARADLAARARGDLGLAPAGEDIGSAARRPADEALQGLATETLQGILGGE